MSEVSVNEAAGRLHVSTQPICRWIAAGKLRATRAGRVWRIRPADVEQLTRSGRRLAHGTTEAHRPGTVGAPIRYLKNGPHHTAPSDIYELEQRIAEARRHARQPAGGATE